MTMAPRQVEDTGLILIAGWGCPFSHRPLAALHLLGHEDRVCVLFVEDVKRDKGWEFASPDPVFGAMTLPDLYERALLETKARPSIPLLIDSVRRRVVSTESLWILRYFSTGLDGAVSVPLDLCPTDQIARIEALIWDIHDRITRAVYRVGLTHDQAIYESECRALFAALDEMDSRLNGQQWLMGDTITEADLVLFPTLARFDAIYAPLFRCSLRRIADYPALSAYLDRCLAIPELAASFDLGRAKNNYFRSIIHRPDGAFDINPSGIVPL